MQELYLGIDLGTTNSKAAFLDYREPSPEPTTLRLRQTVERVSPPVAWDHVPSVVLFEPDGQAAYVGEYARRYAVNFPGRAVRAVKRLMGKNWQHKVGDRTWTPQGISALILKKVRSEAVEALHDTSDDLASVAISVPASFGSRQREATIEAAHLAGFPGRITLIDEPSAALIHYIYDRWQTGAEVDFHRLNRVLVFDMGGGTLDVSLAEVEPDDGRLQVRIRSRSRYTELAGTEFDLTLAAYVVQMLVSGGLKLPEDRVDRRDVLRTALFDMAEPLKTGMSETLRSYFNWVFSREGPAFDDLSQLVYSVSPRERELMTVDGPIEIPPLDVPFHDFERVLRPFFEPENESNPEGTGTIYGPVCTALKEAGLENEEIDIVLMHGGMCELPLIQAGLMNYFPPTTLVTASPDPMTSVAKGAALYHARERQRALIDVQEPALFESIFYQHEEGFELAVGKDRRVGETGVVELHVSRGTRRIRLELYQGFDSADPLLTHDRDMRVELPATTADDCTVDLRWEIQPNRTVTFMWRVPGNDDDWQPLQELTTARRDAWYPDELRPVEAESVRRVELR